MTLRIVSEPEGTLGVFDDQASKWAAQGLADEEAIEMLIAADPLSQHEAETMIRQLRGRKWPQAAEYVMGWEEARWLAATAAGQPAGNRPLEFDGKGQRINKHGITGYARGCRCDTCEARQGDITHGLGPTGKPSGYAQGCRCPVCTDAKAAYERDRYAAWRAANPLAVRPDEDKQTVYRAVLLSPRVDVLIRHLAGGATPGWIWAAVVERLERDTGYQHAAGKPASGRKTKRLPRLPSGPGSDARTVRAVVNLTPRADDLIKAEAGEDGTTGGWIWEAILEKLEQDTGYQDTARRRASRRRSRQDASG